jgi:isocitrate/isopropylmalate dehydrogenase
MALKALPVLSGDGIGPEVVDAALAWLRAEGFHLPVLHLPFGYDCWLETGVALPEETVHAVREHGVALLGAATTPETGCSSPILALRRALDLELQVRPMPGGGPTLLIHNFAGLYAEPEEAGPPAVSRWILYPEQADTLARAAFQRAEKKVTFVDKPTVRRHAAEMIREAARTHATVDWELVNADAFIANLVRDPSRFDIVAATSFVGDMLSDLMAALGTGLPTAASVSLGPKVKIFEPVHGTAIHRMGNADPTGAIEAARLLLSALREEGEYEKP